MKSLTTLLLFFLISFKLFSQTSQVNQAQLKRDDLIKNFNIYEKDHRGFIVYFSDQTQISYPIDATFNTLEEAMKYYLTGGLMKDMVCVSVREAQIKYTNFIGAVPNEMSFIIDKYIELFDKK